LSEIFAVSWFFSKNGKLNSAKSQVVFVNRKINSAKTRNAQIFEPRN